MKKIINTTNAPAPVGPYNQSVLANRTLYMSGQIALVEVANLPKYVNVEISCIAV